MPDLVVYEATGAYYAALGHHFAGVLPLVKVNPLQVRRFAQARGTWGKTDAVNARIRAMMRAALELVPDAQRTNGSLILLVGPLALLLERFSVRSRDWDGSPLWPFLANARKSAP